ncbi:Rieske 2Fe-2S domain-containing protein [Halocynthiibacter namhaensis]|uniref:Rieske 2Fe-2S domain-containing protein n=1 Tax=Halocynthiibacter namhaensis TaxID=1290553 RepID=UPI000689206E|nr:Rieske 2Fe-2S domain-containing protein [Halocynthiibacter namhaensis]
MTETHWHPVLRASKLKKKPRAVTFEGEKLVLFRTLNGVSAIADRCPHRSASLSKGRVIDGTVECPYHGWRFNGKGVCTHIPLAEGPVKNRLVRSWDAREAHGLVFVTRDAKAAGEIPAPTWDHQAQVSRIWKATHTRR